MRTSRARGAFPRVLAVAAAWGSAVCGAEGGAPASSDQAAHILAGQQKAYLETQLKTFREQRPRDLAAYLQSR